MLNNPADLYFATIQIIAAILLWFKIVAPELVIALIASMLVISAVIDIFT